MHAPPTHSYEPTAHACMHAHNVHIDRVSSALRCAGARPLYPRPPAAPLCRWITFGHPLACPTRFSVCLLCGGAPGVSRPSFPFTGGVAGCQCASVDTRERTEGGPPSFLPPLTPVSLPPREWVLFLCCVCVCVRLLVFHFLLLLFMFVMFVYT